MPRFAFILPAAGAGRRFAAAGRASASKIEFELAGKPVFLHSIERLLEARRRGYDIGQIILAVAPDQLDAFRFRWEERIALMEVTLVAGGQAERWQTVQRALEAVDSDATHIAVHDAARPCVPDKLLDRLLQAAERLDAVVPGLPVSDTLKQVDDHAAVEFADAEKADPLDAILGDAGSPVADARPIRKTVSREGLYAVQTPQVFAADLLRQAYAGLDEASAAGLTDDASLIEATGQAVHIIEGDRQNLKITRPEDAELAEALLLRRAEQAKSREARSLLLDDDDEL